jgi:hypothetical protein
MRPTAKTDSRKPRLRVVRTKPMWLSKALTQLTKLLLKTLLIPFIPHTAAIVVGSIIVALVLPGGRHV